MRKMVPPAESAEEVYRLCISKVRDEALSVRLVGCVDTVVAAESSYREKAARGALFEEVGGAGSGSGVSAVELNAVYTVRMASKKSPGRPLYDKIISSAPYGRCPLCGQRNVSTIDHYLPKSIYPLLSVCPVNLVPACADCNKSKLDWAPAVAGKQVLHPYFDNVDDEPWLGAEVLATAPASVRFSVTRPLGLSAEKEDRIRFHFNLFGLKSLYASHAGEELLNIRHGLVGLFDAAGARQVQLFLAEQARTRLIARVNSWQAVFYKAVSESDWFCSGGFRMT